MKLKDKLTKLIANAVWAEIDKQYIKGSRVHCSFQILPDGSLCIVGDIEIKRKRYGKAFELPDDIIDLRYSEVTAIIRNGIDFVTKACENLK